MCMFVRFTVWQWIVHCRGIELSHSTVHPPAFDICGVHTYCDSQSHCTHFVHATYNVVLNNAHTCIDNYMYIILCAHVHVYCVSTSTDACVLPKCVRLWRARETIEALAPPLIFSRASINSRNVQWTCSNK